MHCMAIFWVTRTRGWLGAAGKSTFMFGVLHFMALIGFGMFIPEPPHPLWWSAVLYGVFGWLSGGWLVLELRGLHRAAASWQTRTVKLVLTVPAAGLGRWVDPAAGWDVLDSGLVVSLAILWAPIAAQGLCIGIASRRLFKNVGR